MTRTGKKVLRGYNRLAFGGIQDAVKLLLSENPESYKLEDMDLFNVAEIRRPKGGGMEIKFFDRLKALQCMQGLDSENQDGISGFYRALEEGTKVFEEEKA